MDEVKFNKCKTFMWGNWCSMEGQLSLKSKQEIPDVRIIVPHLDFLLYHQGSHDYLAYLQLPTFQLPLPTLCLAVNGPLLFIIFDDSSPLLTVIDPQSLPIETSSRLLPPALLKRVSVDMDGDQQNVRPTYVNLFGCLNVMLGLTTNNELHHLEVHTSLEDCTHLLSHPIAIINPAYTVRSVACGADHYALCTEADGAVFTAGLGSRGQLGHGNLEAIPLLSPRRVETLCPVRVVRVACGWWHVVALTDSSDLYSWGWNADGQLGPLISSDEVDEHDATELQSTQSATVSEPCLVDVPLEWSVLGVACGCRHTCALLQEISVVPDTLTEANGTNIHMERRKCVYWGWSVPIPGDITSVLWEDKVDSRSCTLLCGHANCVLRLE